MQQFSRSIWIALIVLIVSVAAMAQVNVVVQFGPPPLPVYEQPPCPAEGYIWVPGYWSYDYDYDDYYWVPGTWVLAPETGYLWTPGYWGWEGSGFIFHEGYWGPRVGFYGGIDYGYGYPGEGYRGGRWDNGQFYYNRSVNNVNVTNIRNVYNTTVVNQTTVNRISYNGGQGGVTARPTAADQQAAGERHMAPVAVQTQHARDAAANPQQRASENRGKPPVAATDKPAAFKGANVVAARSAGGEYTPPPNRGQGRNNVPRPENNAARPENNNVPRPENNPQRGETRSDVPRPPQNNSRPPVHPNDLPPINRPTPPNSGNARADQKYQQQQEKMYAKQEQQRQKL